VGKSMNFHPSTPGFLINIVECQRSYVLMVLLEIGLFLLLI
jgi:hypothetical protein